MDGNGVLFGTLQGNNREVLQRMSVQLPKKHGRGGQSAMRFARQRVEKRDAYIHRCCEMAVTHFITDDKINVKGLVFAGSAQLKNELAIAERFDKRLGCKILGIFDVSYGQDNGFSQAITLASDVLSDVKFV
jgi:peptide chain release factor subunit 1